MEHTKKRWFDNKVIVHLLLITFPIGIYALWKSTRIANWWKIVATALVALIVLIGVKYEDVYDKIYEIHENIEVERKRQFVRDNPGSPESIAILWDIDWSFNTAEEYNEYIELLDTSLNSNESLIGLKKLVAKMKHVEIGKTAPDFEMKDANGNLIKLSDSYKKSDYLLLDFWSSTCGPCRRENKHIRKAYDKYHQKGFEILGVSTDTKKELWLNAVAKDGLIWTNVCSLEKWWENVVVQTYALRQVSANFLLDKAGKIIATDLRGDDLHLKLAELFKGSE